MIKFLKEPINLSNKKHIASIASIVGFIVVSVPIITAYLPLNNVEEIPVVTTAVLTSPNRGIEEDLWADIIIGQPDFSEITPGAVAPNHTFLPHGVIVDRTSSPQKMYVYDAGNNRILGFNWDNCLASTTDPANCSADIVIGQPSMSTSACNGDSGFQNYPTRAPASAATLCPEPEGVNAVDESGSGASMAVDSAGNLYVTDYFNHRVLKYVRPFETDRVADDVWGQANFTDNSCNKGAVSPSNTSLCFEWYDIGEGTGNHWTAGIDVDSSGNLWVADSGNHRVLRFPPGSKTANLVLGQSNFTSSAFFVVDANRDGIFTEEEKHQSTDHFASPTVVRFNNRGWLYVADEGNRRVLVFKPPFTNEMNGEVFGLNFITPSGIDFDPTESGNVWITDSDSSKRLIELWNEDTQTKIKEIGKVGDGNVLGEATGSIGVDLSGNILIAIGRGDYDNDVLLYRKGAAPDLPTKRLFGSRGNLVTSSELGSKVQGVAATDNQLIVAERGRLLFWNDLASLTNGKPADGFASGFAERTIDGFDDVDNACCSSIKADKNHHLWVAMFRERDFPDRILAYQLPLTTGATPIKIIGGGAHETSILPVLGGGQVTFGMLSGVVPTDNSDFLWATDPDHSRVFRIRGPLTANPVVDIILGQTDSTSGQCNRGAPAISGATPNTLCAPGLLALDRWGNLYVSDHYLEIEGNRRVLMFNKDLFPTNNASVIYARDATKIFPDIATWEPAFDSQNRMVIGYNPYHTPNPGPENPEGKRGNDKPGNGRFPGIYNDPLGDSTIPSGFLKEYHSMGFSATFDDQDNLYVGDLNRGRVLVYKKPLGSGPLPDTQAPTIPTNLASTVVSTTQINLSWTASIDNVEVTGYWIIRNGATIASSATNSYHDTTVLPSTTYNYQVIAYDAAGNNSGPSNIATSTTPAVPDTESPTAPTNLTATAVSSSQINLSWVASTDNIAVTGYEVYRNNNKIATVTTTSFGDTGLSASTSYSYFVKARDAAGNVSSASNTVSATTQSPPPATVGNITGTVYSSAGGVVAGAKVSLRVKGSRMTYIANSSGVYTITNLPLGTYSLKFTARKYLSQTVSVTIATATTITKNITLQKR